MKPATKRMESNQCSHSESSNKKYIRKEIVMYGMSFITIFLILPPSIHGTKPHNSLIDTTVDAHMRHRGETSHRMFHQLWRHPHLTKFGLLFGTRPALLQKRKWKRKYENIDAQITNNEELFNLLEQKEIQEVAVKTKKERKQTEAPQLRLALPSYESLLGITPQTLRSLSSNQMPLKPRGMDLRDGMTEALEELRLLRKQMELMQKEITTLKKLQMGIDIDDIDEIDINRTKDRNTKKIQEYEKIAKDVERWAESILFPSSTIISDDDTNSAVATGWTEIPCHKMFKQKWNRNDATRVYLKYMKDSRTIVPATSQKSNTKVGSESDIEWPCVRLYSIIDAPCSEVCTYLAQERHVQEYNQLLDKYQDLDIITPHSKVCYASSPQLLFIKPRDLITFCSHRWKRDGTQIVVNQACDAYNDRTATAFALRGATYISPDPNDPDHKTQIAMLAHASPGSDIPKWASRTAVQSLLPIEPYRLFYKISEGIKQCRPELQAIYTRQQQQLSNGKDGDSTTNMAEMVGNNTGRSSNRVSRSPAGLAQFGYACFWPNGGGTIEVDSSISSQSLLTSPSTADVTLLEETDSINNPSKGDVISD